jgi:hypothetical protein
MSQGQELRRLRRVAIAAARKRGHVLRWSGPAHQDVRLQYADCRNCRAWVAIRVYPQPNEIDVGGNAVALDCPIPGR